MTSTVSDPKTESTTVRRSMIDRTVAMKLAATEYERFANMAAGLPDDDWNKPTDCPAWNVRQLASHVLGMAELAADHSEGDRQRQLAFSGGPKDGWEFTDALTALQVAERQKWLTAEIIAGLTAVGQRATQGRTYTPEAALAAQLPLPFEMNNRAEQWTVGYLLDTILTRDVWMHRVDLCRATGIPMTITAEHDGVIIADVVAEWASRHAEPYRLILTGPAGGKYLAGQNGPTYELDAIEFCRAVSGRGTAQGLLATSVPF